MAAKRPRLSVVEKIQAKQVEVPQAQINPADIANVLFAAKHGLMHLGSHDRVNVSVSMANLEDALQKIAAAQNPAPAAPAPTEAPPAAAATAAAKA